MLTYLLYNPNLERKIKADINSNGGISFFGTISSNQFFQAPLASFSEEECLYYSLILQVSISQLQLKKEYPKNAFHLGKKWTN